MRRLVWALFGLAVLLQLVVLYLPRTPDGPGIPGFDKLVHAGIFLLPAALGVLAGLRPVLLGAILAAHAVLSEVVQHLLLPARAGDAWDVVADLVGLVLGLAIGIALRSLPALRGDATTDRVGGEGVILHRREP
jgi:VanZ family protein